MMQLTFSVYFFDGQTSISSGSVKLPKILFFLGRVVLATPAKGAVVFAVGVSVVGSLDGDACASLGNVTGSVMSLDGA